MTTRKKSDRDRIWGQGYTHDKDLCAVCGAVHRVHDGMCPRCWVEEPEVRLVVIRTPVLTFSGPTRGRREEGGE
jgi:hypothetical protein